MDEENKDNHAFHQYEYENFKKIKFDQMLNDTVTENMLDDISKKIEYVTITTVINEATNKIIEAVCPDRHQAELLISTFTTFAKRGVPPQTAIEILLDLVKIFENYQPNDKE